MSKENVRQFYNHLAEDIALQERFKEMNARLVEEFKGKRPDDITSGSAQPPARYCRRQLPTPTASVPVPEERMDEIFRKELLPVAREAGFEFSLDELKAYAVEAKVTGELSDSELAAVVGGNNCCPCVIGGNGGVIGGSIMNCIIYGELQCDSLHCFCLVGGSGTSK